MTTVKLDRALTMLDTSCRLRRLACREILRFKALKEEVSESISEEEARGGRRVGRIEGGGDGGGQGGAKGSARVESAECKEEPQEETAVMKHVKESAAAER